MTDKNTRYCSLDHFYRNYRPASPRIGAAVNEDQRKRGQIRRRTEELLAEAALQRAVFDPLYGAD